MNNERSIDELVDAFNAKAKAEGRYDGRAFWEVPCQSGSLLDVPETAQSRERVASLLKRIAELKQAAETSFGLVREIQEEIGDTVGGQLLEEKVHTE